MKPPTSRVASASGSEARPAATPAMGAARPAQAWGKTDWLLALAVIAAVMLAYAPVGQAGFIWDDEFHVTLPELRSGFGLARIWFELGATQQYYPVLHSAFWVEYWLWGDAPLGYHVCTLLLHATAVCLFAALLRRLAVPGAWLAAALFALHPVAVESVAWISEQKNTFSLVFYLAAALAYLRFDARRERRWYGWATGCFVLALLSKSVTATLPAALLVVFWWQRGRLTWRRDVWPLLPWFALATAMGVITAWVEQTLIIGSRHGEFTLSLLERGLLAGRVVWFYLGKLLWPAELVFIYPRWTVAAAVVWQYAFPLAALGLLAGLWALRRRTRGPLAAALLFGGSLFPALGFYNVYPFRFSFVADHFQYLACLAPLALFAAGLGWALDRRRTGSALLLPAVGVVLLGGLGLRTWQQAHVYRDNITLFESTLARNPDCWLAHVNLGRTYYKAGRVEAALPHFAAAFRIDPTDAEAHNNLGLALQDLGRTEEAQAQFEAALRLKPGDATTHYNLASLLQQTGRTDAAIVQYETVLRIAPDHVEANSNLGNALLALDRTDEAIRRFRIALRLRPDSAVVHFNLGNALFNARQFPEAIDHYRMALRLNPADAETHNNLGSALYNLGRKAEALLHFEEALRLTPAYTEARQNLERVRAALGR